MGLNFPAQVYDTLRNGLMSGHLINSQRVSRLYVFAIFTEALLEEFGINFRG